MQRAFAAARLTRQPTPKLDYTTWCKVLDHSACTSKSGCTSAKGDICIQNAGKRNWRGLGYPEVHASRLKAYRAHVRDQERLANKGRSDYLIHGGEPAWCGTLHTGCLHGSGPEHCGQCHQACVTLCPNCPTHSTDHATQERIELLPSASVRLCRSLGTHNKEPGNP